MVGIEKEYEDGDRCYRTGKILLRQQPAPSTDKPGISDCCRLMDGDAGQKRYRKKIAHQNSDHHSAE